MRPDRAAIPVLLTVLACLAGPATVRAADVPPWLPRYDLELDLDLAGHLGRGRLIATWTNPCARPTEQLVFNAHGHYVLPDDQVGLAAKTLEILREYPGESIGAKDPLFNVDTLQLLMPPPLAAMRSRGAGEGPRNDRPDGPRQAQPLVWEWLGDTKTALVVKLPFAVGPGQSVTVVIEFTLKIPQKKGRWGQFRDVAFFSNWLPVFAVYADKPPAAPRPKATDKDKEVLPPPIPWDACWQPTPFIAWHQPFFNEAGHYHAVVRLPADQCVACTGRVVREGALPDCRKEIEIDAPAVRDFAFLCSARYREYRGEVVVAPDRPPVVVRVCAFEEHEHYARELVRIAQEALAAYSKWIAPYPYPVFTIAESFFGWNGNECSTLVMIDERVFNMPHLAGGFVDLLVSHEICHQWWYNVVGTNGYCETWMDEAMATHLAHRLMTQKCGKNNALMKYPPALQWLPNIYREDYRTYSFLGALGRGENGPCVQPMQDFQHVVNLFSMTYDKGSRIMGLIEDRLGDVAFLEFLRIVYGRYKFRILRVADFQRELEAFTGSSWEGFFQDWLYGKGLSDWKLEKVEVEGPPAAIRLKCPWRRKPPPSVMPPLEEQGQRTRVVVLLKQKADCTEQTCLGFALPGVEGFPIRVPVIPAAGSYAIPDPPAKFEALQDGTFRVEVLLPCEPEQIVVDPDEVLPDCDPINNFWKTPVRWRFTPLYTFLEETDLTNSYDRWNVTFGPWIYMAGYNDVWYTRATTIGVRAGAYRTQTFYGGAYGAYRTDFRDVVAGVDGVFQHSLYSHLEIGYNFEQRLMTVYQGDDHARRGVLYARHIFQYGSSLYLYPMEYLEGFTMYQDNFLPFPQWTKSNGERYHNTTTMGAHYRKNYLTPYWDPEGGFMFDAFYQGGAANLDATHYMHMGWTQLSYLQSMPDLRKPLAGLPGARMLDPMLRWFYDTRLALRVFAGMSFPTRGQFFTMGGGTMFRGFDLSERQGNMAWVCSAEWRVPLLTGLTWDCCDHCVGLRNVYGALFYDVGNAYQSGTPLGPTAQGLGAGLRLDVTWLSLVERTILRFDAAKAVNTASSWQFWFGVNQPF